MRLTVKIAAIACVLVMVALVFQAPQARATNPTIPADGNAALASGGATASATSQTTGYEASKAIDASASTKWVSSAGTPTFTVTFPNKYYVVEAHLHMADVAQPNLDFYVDTEGTGTWTLAKSVRGNTNLNLVVGLGSMPAKAFQARFLTAVTVTTSSQVWVCDSWQYITDDYTGKTRKVCVAGHYNTVYTTTAHPPQVTELEVWGNLYDRDGDGLANGYEESAVYRQDVAVSGLPMAIPNNGTDVLVYSLDRPRWSGISTQAFLDLEVDHASPGDLAVAIGSWDGTAWQDRLVWVPGGYTYASIWDTTSITYTWQSLDTYCQRHFDPETGTMYCTYYTQWTTHTSTSTYASRAVAAGTGENLLLSADQSPSTYLSTVSSPIWHVRIDLMDATLDASESSAGFRAPAITASELQSRGSWRILVRDWDPRNGAGSLRSASIRTEEKTDSYRADTDGDGTYNDGQEVSAGMFPVALDTDFDGLTDVYEKSSQPLVLTVNGATSTVYRVTDPTKADTDGDGLNDGEERVLGADRAVTDPTNVDTDGDTLWDGYTVSGHTGELSVNTNATRSDTDGDTIPDNTEIAPRSFTFTLDGVSTTRTITTLPYTADSDGDGLKDNEEWAGTTVYGVKTDPSDPDTDDDGLADGQERYMKEVAMPTRKTAGTSLSVPLSVRIAGPVEKVTATYGLSTIDVSNFYLQIIQNSNTVVLRNHQGSGLFNFSSVDLPSSMWGGGTYTLSASSWAPGGILEKYSLLFTIRTSPILKDTDADGLNDTEETTAGSDGWITDPQLSDTDGDTWGDAYEISTRGTNPLAVDTDGDGAQDNVDVDPLHNLVVVVKVNKVHHGAGPWCSPELLGVVRVNDAYTWVTEHRVANEESFTSWACPPPIPTTQYSTSSFGMTYYSDVPDNAPTANIRVTAWAINPGRGDDTLVDYQFSYMVNSAWYSTTTYNGNSWISYEVSTIGLGKAKTLLVTDGQVTVSSAAGQTRMAAQDRFFVLALDLTSATAPFVTGINTILVPRSVFLDSKLKADFSAGNFNPLPNADMYGDDLSKASISDGVAAAIAGTLSWDQANDVLNRLLLNASGGQAHAYVDVTNTALVANLPSDVVKILPWTAVTSGPTGAMPQDFWQKVGAIASTVVNTLVYIGQLIYKGLVALGTFLVNLAQAIVDWGMKALGAVWNAVVQVVQTVASAAAKLFSWISDLVVKAFVAVLDGFKSIVNLVLGDIKQAVAGLLRDRASITAIMSGMPLVIGAIVKARDVIENLLAALEVVEASITTLITALSGGIAAVIKTATTLVTKDAIVKAFLSAVLFATLAQIGSAVVDVINESALDATLGTVFKGVTGALLVGGYLWDLYKDTKKAPGPFTKWASAAASSLLGLLVELFSGDFTEWVLSVLGRSDPMTHGVVLAFFDEVAFILSFFGVVKLFQKVAGEEVVKSLRKFLLSVMDSVEDAITFLGFVGTESTIAAHIVNNDYGFPY